MASGCLEGGETGAQGDMKEWSWGEGVEVMMSRDKEVSQI
jgi:hypothetical protein